MRNIGMMLIGATAVAVLAGATPASAQMTTADVANLEAKLDQLHQDNIQIINDLHGPVAVVPSGGQPMAVYTVPRPDRTVWFDKSYAAPGKDDCTVTIHADGQRDAHNCIIDGKTAATLYGAN